MDRAGAQDRLPVSASFWSNTPPASRTPLDATQLSITGLLILGPLVIVVLGALVLTAEYTTGMIRTSLIAMPGGSSSTSPRRWPSPPSPWWSRW